MKFLKRYINRIQIPITKACNRRCSECYVRGRIFDSVSSEEMSIDELKWAGKLLGNIDSMEITGGEPSTHSKFEEISQNLTNIFQSSNFMLVTNGYLFRDTTKLQLLLNYQSVWVSHYTWQFVSKYTGSTNDYELNVIERFLKNYPHINFMPVHISEHKNILAIPKGRPCGHHLYMPAYYKGRIYGCCVAWALPNQGKSIALTEDWREHLDEIDIPCETCFQSV